MDTVRLSIFRSSSEPLCEMLSNEGIEFREPWKMPQSGPFRPVASAERLELIGAVAAIAVPLATVLTAWIKSKASRIATITTKDNEIVHVHTAGMSVEETAKLIHEAKMILVADTKPKSDS